jgi:hypothetical protein
MAAGGEGGGERITFNVSRGLITPAGRASPYVAERFWSDVGHCVTLSFMAAARQFSARLDAGVVDRLERRGTRSGLNKSRLAERYIDEGMRMEDHPGIVFRDGPTGRRAGLAAGPDVWEVIRGLRSTGLRGEDAIRATAEWSALSVRQVREVVGYYNEYPDEIDARIRHDEEDADAAEERWRLQNLAV